MSTTPGPRASRNRSRSLRQGSEPSSSDNSSQPGSLAPGSALQRLLDGDDSVERAPRSRVEAAECDEQGRRIPTHELRLMKRRQTNRLSAQRVKQQRQAHVEQLRSEVRQLLEANNSSARELERVQARCARLEADVDHYSQLHQAATRTIESLQRNIARQGQGKDVAPAAAATAGAPGGDDWLDALVPRPHRTASLPVPAPLHSPAVHVPTSPVWPSAPPGWVHPSTEAWILQAPGVPELPQLPGQASWPPLASLSLVLPPNAAPTTSAAALPNDATVPSVDDESLPWGPF